MKKILVLLAAFSLSAGVASAQTTTIQKAKVKTEAHKQKHAAKTPEQQADRFAQHLTQKLALSADQTQRVRQIRLAQQQQEQALKDKYTASPKTPAKRQEMKSLKDQFEAQLQQVLTTDQVAKYVQLRDDKIAKHGKGKDKFKSKS
ncbi:hypothetical protein [Hymenobacter elongatus]|uniref:Periplasmic heavy metal sensor n=1 Tax=Hymenobacter elongatus TaxID=877208 RepID=A0A4Z0PPW6_9BACT|nr:hypothetical protein [Hymenobacter elongatus]TGE18330.1 hypothetical protein E5J99_05340 [Hymenobacter elongatus]